MNLDLTWLNNMITAYGKDHILGFSFDNSRRVYRRVNYTAHTAESFDDRFTINTTLESIEILEPDTDGKSIKHIIPIQYIQTVFVLTNPEDIFTLNMRYSLG
jgi:hypothetical protein